MALSNFLDWSLTSDQLNCTEVRRYLEKELVHLMMSFVFSLVPWLTNESSERQIHSCIC